MSKKLFSSRSGVMGLSVVLAITIGMVSLPSKEGHLYRSQLEASLLAAGKVPYSGEGLDSVQSRRRLSPKELVQNQLLQLFAAEVQVQSGLSDFLKDEKGAPFQQAWADYNDSGKGKKSITVFKKWLPEQKQAYLEGTGLQQWLKEHPLAIIVKVEPRQGIAGDIITLTLKNASDLAYVMVGNNNVYAEIRNQKQVGEQKIVEVNVPSAADSGVIKVATPFGLTQTDWDFKILRYSGECSNPAIKDVIFNLVGRLPSGEGEKGECDMTRYGFKNGQSVSPALLNGRITTYFKEVAKITVPEKERMRILLIRPKEVMVGETITVHGLNLAYTGKVLIDNIEAKFTQIDPQNLEVTIPPKADKGMIRIESRRYTDIPATSNAGDLTIYSGQCSEPGINQAFQELLDQKPRGQGTLGQCNPQEYREGHWRNYEDLKSGVRELYGYKERGAPVIDRIDPQTTRPDEWVTVYGSNFFDLQSINIQGVGIGKENYERPSDTMLRIKIPVGAGSDEITVSTLHGVARSPKITIIQPEPVKLTPEITSVIPEGSRIGGRLIIKGKNFYDVRAVRFENRQDGDHVVKYDVISPEEIHADWAPTAIDGKITVITLTDGATAPVPYNAGPILKNGNNGMEVCFPGVGPGCKGIFGGDWLGQDGGSQVPLLHSGCSGEKDGYRACWITRGSIEHDNCCLRNPSGLNCGGPGVYGDDDWFGKWKKGDKAPGQTAGFNWHNGTCKEEWDRATKDSGGGSAWAGVLSVEEGKTDLTPMPSNRYSPAESKGSIDYCAPAGTKLFTDEEAFCCSQEFSEILVYYPKQPNPKTNELENMPYAKPTEWGVCSDGPKRDVTDLTPQQKKQAKRTVLQLGKAKREVEEFPGIDWNIAPGEKPQPKKQEPVKPEKSTKECDPELPKTWLRARGCPEVKSEVDKPFKKPTNTRQSIDITPAVRPDAGRGQQIQNADFGRTPALPAESPVDSPITPTVPKNETDKKNEDRCNPELPKIWLRIRGCLDQESVDEKKTTEKVVPVKEIKPASNKTVPVVKPEPGNTNELPLCSPYVPRYAQPPCREARGLFHFVWNSFSSVADFLQHSADQLAASVLRAW